MHLREMSHRYRTLVVDPPWEYEPLYSVNRTVGKWSQPDRKALPYESMTLAEIGALPVAELAEPSGAYLFCWTTNRYLPATLTDVLPGWGFKYCQTLIRALGGIAA